MIAMDVKCLLACIIMMTRVVFINGHKLRPVYKKLSHLEDAVYAHRAQWKNEMQIFHNIIERKFLNRVVRELLPSLIEKKLLDILKSGVLDIAVDDYNYQRIDRIVREQQLIKVHLNWTYRQLVGAVALVRRSHRKSKELSRQIESLQTSVYGFKSIFNELREENVRLRQTVSGIEIQVMDLSACLSSGTSCGVVKDRSTWDPALPTESSSGNMVEDDGHDELLSTITPEVTEGEKKDKESSTFSFGSGEHTDPGMHTLTPTTDVTDSFGEELEDEKLITLIPRQQFERTSTQKTASEEGLLSSTSGRETSTLIQSETSKLASQPASPLTTITTTTSTTHTDQVEGSTPKTATASTTRPGDAVRDILSLIKN